MVAWPSTIPQAPEAGSFTEQFEDNTIRFQPAVGPAKTRPRATQNSSKFNLVFVLTDTEVTDFSTFYRVTLESGSLEFDFTDPITNTTKQYKFSQPPQLRHRGFQTYTANCVFTRLPE